MQLIACFQVKLRINFTCDFKVSQIAKFTNFVKLCKTHTRHVEYKFDGLDCNSKTFSENRVSRDCSAARAAANEPTHEGRC